MEEILLPNNVIFRSTDKGYEIVASDNSVTEFDKEGKVVKKDDVEEQISKYFFFMGSQEKTKVEEWYFSQKPKNEKEQEFLYKVSDALSVINYPYRIAIIEPSINAVGDIYYKANEKVCVNLSGYQWIEEAMKYSRKHESQLATIEELMLWYAYRVANGELELYQVVEDSSSIGNYCDSVLGNNELQKTGKTFFLNAKDGIGNTYKIVEGLFHLKMVGGDYNSSGKRKPMAYQRYCMDNIIPHQTGVGVIVLKK